MLDIDRRDTICAAATPIAPSALAVIRVSGTHAEAIKESVFTSRKGGQKHFVATLGDFQHPKTRALLDEVLCTYFPEGKSYTGESSFEISVHGNPVTIKLILEALQQAGCRLAAPGEFTLRAVLTGKLDLCAAEAVGDLIHARSAQAAAVALRALKGGLQAIIDPLRITIIDALCEIEARLDFPDEDLGAGEERRMTASLAEAHAQLERLLKSAHSGTRLMDGARVVFYGEPNVGKSTLLNALLEENRALVHELPGTTRDVIEAAWILGGVPITLVDVAGIRVGEHLDPVERLGIERAQQEFDRADVIIWLKNQGSTLLAAPSPAVVETPVLQVYTKADLWKCDTAEHSILALSAQTGFGLDSFKQALQELILRDSASLDEVLLTKMRQREEVAEAQQSLAQALMALKGKYPHEVIASELRGAGAALDRLLGKSLGEDVLDLIFSRFCIGK